MQQISEQIRRPKKNIKKNMSPALQVAMRQKSFGKTSKKHGMKTSLTHTHTKPTDHYPCP
jgi:hypothetical protein